MIFRTHVGHENGTASEEAAVDRWVMDWILAVCAAKSNTLSLTRNCLGRLGTNNCSSRDQRTTRAEALVPGRPGPYAHRELSLQALNREEVKWQR